jgi:hypothetical protein
MQPPPTGAMAAYEGRSTSMAEAKSDEPLKDSSSGSSVLRLPLGDRGVQDRCGVRCGKWKLLSCRMLV